MKANAGSMLLIASLVACLVACLGGCAGVAGILGAHVNAYPGKELPIEQVAVLLPQGSQVARVDGKHVGDATLGYPSDVRVLPGERMLGLDCQKIVPAGMGPGMLTTRIELTGHFEAGHFYAPYCNEHGEAQYTAELRDLGTRDPRKKKD